MPPGLLLGLWIPLLAVANASSIAVPQDPDLCLIKVRNEVIDRPAAHTSPNLVILLPGYSLPYISWLQRDGGWTIDASRSLVPFPGPPAWHGKFVMEPDNGRIVLVNTSGIFVAQKPQGAFRQLIPAHGSGLYLAEYVAALGRTFVGGSRLRQLHENRLTDVPGSEAIGEIAEIADTPMFGGVVIAAIRKEEASAVAVYLYTYQGDFLKLATLHKDAFETGPVAVALSRPRGILLRTLHQASFVPMRSLAGREVPGTSIPLIEHGILQSGRDNQAWLVRGNKDFLVFGRGPEVFGLARKNGLERLAAGGWESVPGADLPAISGIRPHEIPSRDLVVFVTGRGLFTFDGVRTSRIDGSEPEKIGQVGRVRDLPSIGRTLVSAMDPGSTRHSLYELSAEGRLSRLDVPFFMENVFLDLDEMPASRRAVLSMPQGVFSIDEAGVFRSIRSRTPEGGNPLAFKGLIPEREEMIFAGRTGLHLIVDERLSGKGVCHGID